MKYRVNEKTETGGNAGVHDTNDLEDAKRVATSIAQSRPVEVHVWETVTRTIGNINNHEDVVTVFMCVGKTMSEGFIPFECRTCERLGTTLETRPFREVV